MLKNKVIQAGDEEISNDLTSTISIETDYAEIEEGLLAIEAYETDKDVVFLAPVAGAKEENIKVTINNGLLTIRGHRSNMERKQSLRKYLCQECFWGSFSRSIQLPQKIANKKPHASLKNGILKIRFHKK